MEEKEKLSSYWNNYDNNHDNLWMNIIILKNCQHKILKKVITNCLQSKNESNNFTVIIHEKIIIKAFNNPYNNYNIIIITS